MKRGLLIFLAMSAFALAMVPRERRAVNTEEEEELLRSQSPILTSTDKADKVVCAPQTPCAWAIYKQSYNNNKYIEINITNTYCDCGPGTVCQFHEDDIALSTFVHRCRAPVEEDKTES